MISFESQKVRHIVARLSRGERLQAALKHLAEEREIGVAWISALGAFECCELSEYDQAAERYRPARRFDAPMEILNLTGNISLRDGAPFAHVHVTVSREKGDAIEIIGGHLVDATVFACELRLDVYDDLVLAREHDAATGLSLWSDEATVAEADTRPSEAPTGLARVPDGAPAEASGGAGSGVSWADVAEESAAPKASPQTAVTGVAPAPAFERRLSLAERRKRAKARQAEQKSSRAFLGTGKAAKPARAREPLPEKRRMTEAEFFEEPIPERGDFVDHRVFGLCHVDGESDTGGLIIRMDNGVRKTIKLDYMEVEAPRVDAAGRKIFPLRPKRRSR